MDHAYALSPAHCWILLLLTAGAALARTSIRRVVLMPLVFAAGCATGALLDQALWRRAPSTDIARCIEAPFSLARVRGRVIDSPRVIQSEDFAFARWMRPAPRCVFLMEVEEVAGDAGWLEASGRLRVSLEEPLLEVRLGDRVEAFGRLHGFWPRRNPGGFDGAAYFHLEGISAGLNCESALNVRRVARDGRTGTVTEMLAGIRDWWRRLMMDDWPVAAEGDRGFIETLVLGQRSTLDRRIDRLFADLGLTHIMAVSGSHLAAIMGGAWGLSRLLALRRGQASLLMFLSTLVYASVTEPRAPCVRAVIGAGLYCIGGLGDLRARPVNILAAAALVIAWVDPMQVFTAGFQLSFAAAGGIVILVPALRRCGVVAREAFQDWQYGYVAAELRRRVAQIERRQPRAGAPAGSDVWSRATALHGEKATIAFRLLRGLVLLPALVSLCAWVATAPLVAWHFNQVQWMGPLNTMVIWLPAAALVNLGFLALLLSGVAPAAAVPVKWLMSLLEELTLSVAARLPSGFPWIMSMPAPPIALMILWYGSLIAFALAFKAEPLSHTRWGAFAQLLPDSARSRVMPRWGLSALCLLVLITGSLSFAWLQRSQHRESLRVTTLSVGSGLAVVIELPSGRTLLYDCGSDAPFDVGRQTVVPFLRSRGINRVDAVFLSHANLDHFSGLPGLIETLPVGTVHVTPFFQGPSAPGSPARHLIDWMCSRGGVIEKTESSGPAWSGGDVRMEQVWPGAEAAAGMDANDLSLVLRLTYRGRSILLTGDIEAAAQAGIIQTQAHRLASEVLLVPHHGSTRTNSPQFIAAVNPRVVIQSDGPQTARQRETLRGWLSGREWFNTAEVGAVTVEFSSAGLVVRTGGDGDVAWRNP
ncbi:MAG: ComEC/Rec2 family competence protein [Phycisphaerales bacterium]|nr:ComEC/Rec2 family competence protein [Phycisphaerales bacterium]